MKWTVPAEGSVRVGPLMFAPSVHSPAGRGRTSFYLHNSFSGFDKV
eukprot:CAMPEP_0173313358 /NCGR_PEP_ID=MMETSP1143-20121109/24698_1 /TAXON_ID=483371 /ORGANISM="non described non described, Strain CCMP2298" /LENGTH=45 /DNA_ID= /DNA_START= /DNA_END= /DNA_ORIENTATION=